jgi:glycosyltransferase involved in cell wall biosynthesis
MKKPLVSVVITCYNYADYVGDAIESVLNQTYDNIQLIVINDGSTDDSDIKIKAYASNERVTLVSRENKGIIYTRNEGVALSKGEFSMQLDADDILEPTYIEECVALAQRETLDIVYTQTRVFGRMEFESDYQNFDLEKLKHYGYIHASSLVRRSKMKENPYDEYLDKLGNEDWDMFLDMCLDGAKAGLVDKPLLNYRKHIDRKSRADNFEGLFNETLVMHHIWQKQNAKHPNEFWYFSSQINHLFSVIKVIGRLNEVEAENLNIKSELDAHKNKIHRIESTLSYKILRKISGIVSAVRGRV